MNSYRELMMSILLDGESREDRTGTGTKSIFGYQFRHRMDKGFPLLTTKKIHLKSVIHELLWFIKGDTNIKYLNDNGVTIWDEWADKDGELGPVYGEQWRSWPNIVLNKEWELEVLPSIDQLQQAIDMIKLSPDSRRIVVSAWNPVEVPNMALPPCHMFFQFYCHTDGGLSLHMYQRSADAFLGVPFNIASYAFLLEMVAKVTGRHAHELIISFGDLHIYNNHYRQVIEQMSREPRTLPTLQLADRDNIDDFVYEDFVIEGYNPYPPIKAPIAV